MEPPQGYVIKHSSGEGVTVGFAPDIPTACTLMAALYARTGEPLKVTDALGDMVAWIESYE